MKTRKILFPLALGISAIFVCCFSKLEAVSLDGTIGTAIYQAASYPFANGDFATGYVRFASGFSVPGGGTVTIGIHEPVSGVINLSNGTISLSGDLYLAAGASIVSAGGTIQLNGHTLYLQDNLDLSAANIHIVANPSGTVDGLNHRIFLNPGNNTFNYGGVDLTFRNLRFEGCRFNNVLSINPNGVGLSTRLDSVSFLVTAGQEFTFVSQFFHIYRYVSFDATENTRMNLSVGPAPGQLFIHSGATLYAGPGVNFGFSSSTNPVFDDTSATMYFNGSSFEWFSSLIETALVNGTLVIENKVQFRRTGDAGFNPRLRIGDGTAANDLNLLILPGSTLRIANQPPFTTTLIYGNVG